MAPSVTKGCAVASLQTKLMPVPEHCRPAPPPLYDANAPSVYTSRLFEDEPEPRLPPLPAFGLGGMGGGF